MFLAIYQLIQNDDIDKIQEILDDPQGQEFIFDPSEKNLPEILRSNDSLIHAAAYCNATKCLHAINSKWPSNTKFQIDLFGRNFLHILSYTGNVTLLSDPDFSTYNFNSVDINGKTPLFYAIEQQQFDCVKYLVETKGVNINHKNSMELNPLHVAAEIGNVKIFSYLLDHGCEYCESWNKSTPMSLAINYGQIEIVKFLFSLKDKKFWEYSKDVYFMFLEFVSNFSESFHLASLSGFHEAFPLIKENTDYDINKIDEFGYAPIHYASEYGFENVYKVISSIEGSDINLFCLNGISFIYLMLQFIFQLFLDR